MARTIEIQGQEHATIQEALVELNFSGDHAIGLGGRTFTVSTTERERIEQMGIEPTMFHFNEAAGRIVSVPGRQG